MSRVEKHNPLKSGVMAQKRAALKGDASGRMTEIKELTFDTVREDAIQYGLATDVIYQINAGKEASIFLAQWRGHHIILKAYRLGQSSHKMSKKKGYVAQGTSKRTYFILGMMEDLAVMEYDYLMNCFRAGVHVPTPIGRVGNYLTMRFIGDGTQPAPQLKDVCIENPEKALNQILDDYLLMYSKAHYVHGDLSKYNILWWQDRPWIIDVPQAVPVNKWSDMLRVEKLLMRDIRNVLDYFESYDIHRDPEHTLEVFLSEYIPENLKNYSELRSEGIELH
ncbi:MAG: RIO1 family regulatory kinase/ATPase [Candidatus Thorarchaeota archaeon]